MSAEDFVDYYAILEVPPDVAAGRLKKAYRDAARKWHPDKNRDRLKEAAERFDEIQKAYDLLSDEKERQLFHAKYTTHMAALARREKLSAKRKHMQDNLLRKEKKTLFGRRLGNDAQRTKLISTLRDDGEKRKQVKKRKLASQKIDASARSMGQGDVQRTRPTGVPQEAELTSADTRESVGAGQMGSLSASRMSLNEYEKFVLAKLRKFSQQETSSSSSSS